MIKTCWNIDTKLKRVTQLELITNSSKNNIKSFYSTLNNLRHFVNKRDQAWWGVDLCSHTLKWRKINSTTSKRAGKMSRSEGAAKPATKMSIKEQTIKNINQSLAPSTLTMWARKVVSAKRPAEVDPAHRYKKVTHQRIPQFYTWRDEGQSETGVTRSRRQRRPLFTTSDQRERGILGHVDTEEGGVEGGGGSTWRGHRRGTRLLVLAQVEHVLKRLNYAHRRGKQCNCHWN